MIQVLKHIILSNRYLEDNIGFLGIFLLACLCFLVAYLVYGNILKKLFKLDPSIKTPAVLKNDGLDYVPIEPKLLLGQHFSAIAAAGPIVGPIVAGTMFGWVGIFLWILIGAIFIGGIHDFSALIGSVRHGGSSISELVKRYMSRRTYLLFLSFIWITLIYLITVFTDITASSFVGKIILDNGEEVRGGAIATSSILYLILPLLMGLMLKYGKINLTGLTLIFLPLVGISIWIGKYFPLSIDEIFNISTTSAIKIIDVALLIYCFLASIVPMWLLLQPRGYLGGWFLYVAIIGGLLGLLFGNKSINYPAFLGFTSKSGEPLFPILFILVACGACSGFHAIVGSGTTSKQIKKEPDTMTIGYGAMLLEGLVAIIALSCLIMLAPDDPLVKKSPNYIYAHGIGRFLEVIGINSHLGISFGLMAFTTFVYDTLDISTRLGRYIIEELTKWRTWSGKIFATILTSGVPLFFVTHRVLDAQGNSIPAWKIFWPLFGVSNQLLAALTLMTISVWLINTNRGKRWFYFVTFLPAMWMYIVSISALFIILKNSSSFLNPVFFAALILVLLGIIMFFEVIKYIRNFKNA